MEFEENEEQGYIPPLDFPLPNIVQEREDDKVLFMILYITEYATLVVIIYMLWKRKPLVWHIIDTVVTFCFMQYLSIYLPDNLKHLFQFYNLKYSPQVSSYLPRIIESWVEPINNQTAEHGFNVRDKTTLFIANMDLCLVILGVAAFIYIILKIVAMRRYNKTTKKFDLKTANRLTKKCVAVYEDMEGDGWMQIVNSFYMKVAVFAFL